MDGRIEIAITAVKELLGNDGVKEFLCGTYSDGTTRNLTDSIKGEFTSPKQKKKKEKKKKKNKKKKPVKLKL